jgi:hypothetical protein
MRARGLLVALCAALAGCASSFASTWKDPDWEGAPLTHVLVVGKAADATSRRTYEDAVVARLASIGVRAEPSWRTVADDAINPEEVARAVAAGGQDGVIAARLVSVDERFRYLPGTTPPGINRAPNLGWRSWDGFTEPGTWRVDRIARIETQVWALVGEGTMIWAGTSESVNPRDVSTLAQSLADDTVTELQRVGVLPGE